MSPLNPAAQPWTPSARSASQSISIPSGGAQPSAADYHGLPEDPFAPEMSVSPAELEELEEVEGWVSLMAELEGMEQDHLIELSLRHADKSKIAQIKAAAMSKGKHKHHHGHHKHHHAHKASSASPPKA